MADSNLQIIIDAQNRASKQIEQVSKSLDGLSKTSSSANQIGVNTIAVGTMLGNIYGKLGTAIFGFGKSLIMAAGQYEQTKIAFEVMMGSAEKANTLLKDLSDFAFIWIHTFFFCSCHQKFVFFIKLFNSKFACKFV